MRAAVAYCVEFALLAMASGLALVNCPFTVSSYYPSCCHNKYAPKKCPLSNSFETCPYVPLDSKDSQPNASLDTAHVVFPLNAMLYPSLRMESEPAAWTPSLTDLHIRIRVLLV
jgi:hypothetical protein